jgi:multiple antibiotic resistance protein
MLGLGAIFTLFFVTLGPIKLLGPFSQQTQDLGPATLRGIALRVSVIGLAAVLAAAYLGTALAEKWHVSTQALEITAGLILCLVAMRLAMQPYEPARTPPPPLPAAPWAATLRLTFPLVVTPYGIAAVIAVLESAVEPRMVGAVYLILVIIMGLNLLAMLFARDLVRPPVLLVLQVLGAVLGVLQVGLAVQIIIRALRDLQVLPA